MKPFEINVPANDFPDVTPDAMRRGGRAGCPTCAQQQVVADQRSVKQLSRVAARGPSMQPGTTAGLASWPARSSFARDYQPVPTAWDSRYRRVCPPGWRYTWTKPFSDGAYLCLERIRHAANREFPFREEVEHGYEYINRESDWVLFFQEEFERLKADSVECPELSEIPNSVLNTQVIPGTIMPDTVTVDHPHPDREPRTETVDRHGVKRVPQGEEMQGCSPHYIIIAGLDRYPSLDTARL